MSLLVIDHIHTAKQSLVRNRLRTALTTLGIAIGIASVTAILALAHGVSDSVSQQVSQLGGNVAVIRPGHASSQEDSANPLALQRYTTSTLRENDITVIKKVNPDIDVAPLMTLQGTLKAGKDSVPDGTIVATTPDLAATAPLPIENGEFISDKSSSTTATIGQQLAIDLYGEENPIGNTFTLRGQTFTIVGVFKRLNNPVNYNGIDFDRAVVISLSDGKSVHNGGAQIQQINIAAPSSGALAKAITDIKRDLTAAHGEQDFTIVAGEEVATPTNQLFDLLARVMTAIAAISLVVGGIGIMNIMLVSVAERTREIGIRKSVGASSKTILAQFLIESLMMSLLGGLIGVILGIIVAFVIGRSLFFMPAFTWTIVFIAFGLALVVGVGFGMYPAIRAARKDPMVSLRQYR